MGNCVNKFWQIYTTECYRVMKKKGDGFYVLINNLKCIHVCKQAISAQKGRVIKLYVSTIYEI